jgi:hypothetical protein
LVDLGGVKQKNGGGKSLAENAIAHTIAFIIFVETSFKKVAESKLSFKIAYETRCHKNI